MTAPNPSWEELASSTLYNRRGKAADNMKKSIAGLMAIEKSKSYETFDGGISLLEEIEYQENPNHVWYQGYEQIPTAPHDHLSSYEYAIKQAAISFTISGLEMIQNSGLNAKIKLVASRTKNMEKTAKNKQSTAFYGDGTGDGGKQLGGLGYLLPADETAGSVGGISRVSNTIARHISLSGVTDFGVPVGTGTIRSMMGQVMTKASRGDEYCNIVLAGETFWTYLHDALMGITAITPEANDEYAKAGFQTLKYRQRPVVLDAGFGAACPAEVMYFLQTAYIKYRPYVDRDWAPLNPSERHPLNQDAMVKLMAFAGNMTMSCAFLQGRLGA